MALIETVGASNANTYQTASGAVDYFAARLGGEAWPSGDAAKCEQALLTAMRLLEPMPWIGQRANTTQALQWPRAASCPRERIPQAYQVSVATGAGLYDRRGRFWAFDVIPQPIKDAQCEIAYAMLLDPSLNDPALVQALLRTGNLTIDHRKPAATRLRMAYESLSGLIEHSTRLSLS